MYIGKFFQKILLFYIEFNTVSTNILFYPVVILSYFNKPGKRLIKQERKLCLTAEFKLLL